MQWRAADMAELSIKPEEQIHGEPQQATGVLTVILAEEDDDLRWALATLLRADGYRVVEAPEGGAVLEAMVRGELEGIDSWENVLLVKDAPIRHADALGLIRELKALGTAPPFILMSRSGDHLLRAEAIALGALAAFYKPFAFEELRGVLLEAVRTFRLH
jgi:DNA-binding response OmpR family regulator